MRTADDGAALWPDRYLIDGRLVVVRSPRGLECGDPRSLEPPGRPVEHLVDHRTWRGGTVRPARHRYDRDHLAPMVGADGRTAADVWCSPPALRAWPGRDRG